MGNLVGNRVPKDAHEAFRQVVYDFGIPNVISGPDRLSAMTGIPSGTLSNKCNINDTSHHKPTLADCVLVTLLTGDKRIVQAFARTVGGVYYEFPDFSSLTTDALMVHILKIAHENGDFHRAIERATERDGISRKEYVAIEKEGHELIAAILESLVRMKEMSGGDR